MLPSMYLLGSHCQPKCNPHYLLRSGCQPKCNFHCSNVHISHTTNPCHECLDFHLNTAMCWACREGSWLSSHCVIWKASVQPGLWRAKFSQVLKALKMPLKQQILEQHQSAKASQFKYISPKDLAQLNKKNILYPITFRIHTSPVPLGIWSFIVAILTE